MSIYKLNSIVKKNNGKNLSDISDVLNKKNIWIKHPLSHAERIGWIDFNKVTKSSQDECSKTLKNLESKKFVFIGMGGSIQTGKVLSQISNENNMLFIDSTNPIEIKSRMYWEQWEGIFGPRTGGGEAPKYLPSTIETLFLYRLSGFVLQMA